MDSLIASTEEDSSNEIKNIIKEQADIINRQLVFLQRYKNLNYSVILIGLILFICVPIFHLFDQPIKTLYSLFIISTTILTFNYFVLTKYCRRRQFELANRQDYFNINKATKQKQAESLFRSQLSELMRFYDLGLNQSTITFFIGVFCILIGFFIIAISIYFITRNESTSEEQILVTIIGSVGNILINYIAYIYLKILSESNASLREFHLRLLETHNLHFKNFLLNDIKNDEIRDKTIQELITEKIIK